MKRVSLARIGVLAAVSWPAMWAQERALNQAPAGFTLLFNGKDLFGWRGRQPNYDPQAEAALSKDERAAKQAQ